MAYQVWYYLAATMEEGLIFKGNSRPLPLCEGAATTTTIFKGNRDKEDLMVYTDASFGEEDAHGCVVLQWGEDPLVWRSSKQGMLTTSTAEAELVEVMERAITTEAVRVMV